MNAPAALSEVRYVNSAPIKQDAARLKRMGGRFSECFMTAPSPGIVATTMLNQHYDSHEAYLMALAKALANEYRAIHDAGLILQIDAPDLAMERHRFFDGLNDAEFLAPARTACRGDQSGHRGHSPRPHPAACLLGQQ